MERPNSVGLITFTQSYCCAGQLIFQEVDFNFKQQVALFTMADWVSDSDPTNEVRSRHMLSRLWWTGGWLSPCCPVNIICPCFRCITLFRWSRRTQKTETVGPNLSSLKSSNSSVSIYFVALSCKLGSISPGLDINFLFLMLEGFIGQADLWDPQTT